MSTAVAEAPNGVEVKPAKVRKKMAPVESELSEIPIQVPYRARVKLRGTCEILFHAWNVKAIEDKQNEPKGSKKKKSDNVESYVRRDEEGYICIPTEYLRMCLVNTSKFQQDPRSPRKSAADLFKAAIVSMTDLCRIEKTKCDTRGDRSKKNGEEGKEGWDEIDVRRVTVQRAGINRSRPKFHKNWEATFDLMVTLPEYVSPVKLRDTLRQAGVLTGIADFRPSFGRFQVAEFEIVPLDAEIE